jgi:hypothetical protein
MYHDKREWHGMVKVGNFRTPLGSLHQQMGNCQCENTDYCRVVHNYKERIHKSKQTAVDEGHFY